MQFAEWLENTSRDLVANFTQLTQFGRNTDVDITTAPEDVWRSGGAFVPPTAARVHAVVSSSANDASAGTGVRTVRVFGVNGSYALVAETVAMDGTTPVNTSNSYLHIYRLQPLTFGSGGVSAGTITATAATDSTVTNTLTAGHPFSANSAFLVPAGYTAHILRFAGSLQSSTAGAEAVLQLKTRAFGESGFVVEKSLSLSRTDRRISNYEFNPPLTVTEKGWIKLTIGEVSKDNSDVYGQYDIILVAD